MTPSHHCFQCCWSCLLLLLIGPLLVDRNDEIITVWRTHKQLLCLQTIIMEQLLSDLSFFCLFCCSCIFYSVNNDRKHVRANTHTLRARAHTHTHTHTHTNTTTTTANNNNNRSRLWLVSPGMWINATYQRWRELQRYGPNTIQYNITLLPSVNTLTAQGMFCRAKYTHHRYPHSVLNVSESYTW